MGYIVIILSAWLYRLSFYDKIKIMMQKCFWTYNEYEKIKIYFYIGFFKKVIRNLTWLNIFHF